MSSAQGGGSEGWGNGWESRGSVRREERKGGTPCSKVPGTVAQWLIAVGDNLRTDTPSLFCLASYCLAGDTTHCVQFKTVAAR